MGLRIRVGKSLTSMPFAAKPSKKTASRCSPAFEAPLMPMPMPNWTPRCVSTRRPSDSTKQGISMSPMVSGWLGSPWVAFGSVLRRRASTPIRAISRFRSAESDLALAWPPRLPSSTRRLACEGASLSGFMRTENNLPLGTLQHLTGRSLPPLAGKGRMPRNYREPAMSESHPLRPVGAVAEVQRSRESLWSGQSSVQASAVQDPPRRSAKVEAAARPVWGGTP